MLEKKVLGVVEKYVQQPQALMVAGPVTKPSTLVMILLQVVEGLPIFVL